MAPRRNPLLVLSALALILTSFAIAPRPASAQALIYQVDTLLDETNEPGCATPQIIDGDCSLRQAIVAANNPANRDLPKVISFNQILSEGGFGPTPYQITLNLSIGRLPDLSSNNIELLADVISSPRVIINGNGLDSVLKITGNNNLVSGFSIVGASDSGGVNGGTGIFITGNSNRVQRSFIGILPNGDLSNPRNFSGIRITSGTGNVIGITGGPLSANYISGNVQNGIIIRDASNNTVQNNIIGLYRVSPEPLVLAPRPNDSYGIQILSDSGTSSNNLIGGSSADVANIIGANVQTGILLSGTRVSTNTVQANYIGLDRETSTIFGNLDGIRIEDGANNNTLAGTALAPLLISGNTGYGVRIRPNGGNRPRENRISGLVYIGTARDGHSPIGNTAGGVRIDDGLDNVIAGSGNNIRIVANGGPGVFMTGSQSSGNRVEGTLIGVAPLPNGTLTARPNLRGVEMLNATNSIVAGSTIRNNTEDGVFITGGNLNAVQDSTILGNGRDGVRISGGSRAEVSGGSIREHSAGMGVRVINAAFATLIDEVVITQNQTGGVLFDTADSGTVTRSVVSDNANFGIRLNATTNTTIRTNTIGLNFSRNSLLPNTGPGIELLDATKTFIDFDNLVVGNSGLGLSINGGSTVTVDGNRFGFYRNAQGVHQAAPNGGVAQILITNAATHVTLNNNRLAGNATAATGPAGLRIEGDATLMATSYVTVTLNQIGQVTDSNQTFTFPHGDAIVVDGARDIKIGGATTSERNLIRENYGAAMRLVDVFEVEIRNNARDLVLDAASAPEAIFKNQGGGIVVATSGNPPPVGPPTFDSQLILIENNQLAENSGDAIAILGNPTLPWLADLQLRNNFLRANTGNGIFVSGNVDRASFRGNLLRANGGPIRLDGTTRYNPNNEANPGDPNLPNHDIDPPWVNVGVPSDARRLRLTDQGLLEGYVITSTNRFETQLGPASACVTCTVQVFRPLNPADPQELGQGGVLVESSADVGSELEASFAVDPDTGFFSRQLFDNPSNNTQLLLVATDGFVNGNSSEYATFPISRGLVFEPLGTTTPGTLGSILTLPQDAAPGAVLTFTMQLRNLGSLTMTGLTLNASGLPSDWGLVSNPPLGTTLPQLVDGAVQPVTITLTLPTGSATSIRAGTLQRITITARNNIAGSVVTAQANLEVRMLARPLLSLSPLTSTRSAPPGFSADHLYVVRNDGNITVTVNFAAVTSDSTGPTTLWTTRLSRQNATIGPGAEDSLRVTVLVPPGTQQGVSAETSITATVPANPAQGYTTITRTATATTRASLASDAILLGGADIEAIAGAVVPFRHRVLNLSNGTAVFCVSARTNKLSTVSFASATTGFVINSNGCFTLDTGNFREAEFIATVTVDQRLLPGELETINLELRKATPNGELIGDATATNTILITRGLPLPRLWLPLIFR